MFTKLFGKNERAERREDHVWMNDAARHTGFLREALRGAEEGKSIVAVARTVADFEQLHAALQGSGPHLCKDLFGQTDLFTRLDQPKAITIALDSALPRTAPGNPRASSSARSTVPVEFHVLGRHARRTEDDAILACADSLSSRSAVIFHLSFDEPFLKRTVAPIQPLLEKLGMSVDEPIAHSLVTRAIEKAQREIS